jgi:hypothetical protein
MDLDFTMLPASAPVPACETRVVAVTHWHRLLCATVTWLHASGLVLMSLESDAGLASPTARTLLQRALVEARSSTPANEYGNAKGPQFTNGAAFAKGLSHALAIGDASFYA